MAVFMRARSMDGSGPFNEDGEWDLSNPHSRHYKAKNIVMQKATESLRLSRKIRTTPYYYGEAD